jgi:hypothetical protein
VHKKISERRDSVHIEEEGERDYRKRGEEE